MMSKERNTAMQDYYLISRVAHVIERSGLAMAGAMCGTFVAAQMSKVNVALFGSIGFAVWMVLIGMVGFYLGIDIPRLPSDIAGRRPKMEPVEWLSAAGTFLAAVAALVSVYGIVLDEVPPRVFEFVVGSWWALGIAMQVGAGLIGRLRPAAGMLR
jgi:hypothetical protein